MSMEATEVSADIVRALLRHFAWEREVSTVVAPYEMWHLEHGRDDTEVIVPTDPTRGDYAVLLERATQSLLRRYGVLAEQLARDIELRQSGILDATRWKKETAVPAGLIAWGEGQELYQSAQLQLVAAAKTARDPRAYHGNASSYVAKRFLEQSFMGQTDVGSFIITALTPAQARIHVTRHSEEVAVSRPREAETVTGRSILETFNRALAATRAGLDEYVKRPNFDVFLDKIDAGVSHEMTKALGTFAARGESAIQIELEQWGDVAAKNVEYDFKPQEAPVLLSLASELAQDPEPRNVTVEGLVTLLSRNPEQSERVIRLSLMSGSSVRKVRVRLSTEQYELAMQAHGEERPLRATGSLEREGPLYWLYAVRDVAVVRDADRPRSTTRVSQVDEALEFDDTGGD